MTTSTEFESGKISRETGVQHTGGDLTYGMAALFLRVLRIVPASQRVVSIERLSLLAGRLLYSLKVPAARTIRANMRAVLGNVDDSDVYVRHLLSMTVWNALVLNSLPVLPRQQIATLAHLHGRAHLDEALMQGAVLICGYHFGVQPLVVAAILHAHGYPVHAITHVRQMPNGASRWQRFYLKQLDGVTSQFPVIDPRDGVQREMLDALKQRACLYMTPDYMVPPSERDAFTVPVNFLGHHPYVQVGGLRLAKRLKANFVTVVTELSSEQRRLVIAPWAPPTDGFKPEALRQDLQSLLVRLEEQVRQTPYLWLDFKRDDLRARLGCEENVKSNQE